MTLSIDQQQAISFINEGKNVFLTGEAGCGKSYLLSMISGKNCQMCASTGVAAFNISGITINSFLNLGLGDKSVREIYSTMSQERKNFISSIKRLIIDEVSMISSEMLNLISDVLSKIRGDNRDFGNLQLVLCGDLLQLENISGTSIMKNEKFKKFQVASLTTNFRQSEDHEWKELLSRMRIGEMTSKDHEFLEGITTKKTNKFSIYPTNKDVSQINKTQYSNLPSSEYSYLPVFSGKIYLVNEIKKQFAVKGLDNLKLKLNARVMLLRNLDVELGLVNGALGTVVSLTVSHVEVLFDHLSQPVVVKKVLFEKRSGNDIVTATQIPLCLCFSSTIHKVQGLTFDECSVSVGNSFANNMTYVALSRVKKSSGLELISYSRSRVKTNLEAVKYYSCI